MAEILQYKCVKNDSKPWLFSDNPVPEEWRAAQLACQTLMNAARELLDTLEITDTEIVMRKHCENDVAKAKFILAVAMLEVDHTFAQAQFDIYHESHNTTFSYSEQEV
jgi:hypothetical protein